MTYQSDPPDPGSVTCPNCGAKDEPCDYWCADLYHREVGTGLLTGLYEGGMDEFPEGEDHDIDW